MRYRTRHDQGTKLAAHRHGGAYLAFVEHGGFTESSTGGVFDCEAGMAIVHPAWHLHADCFASDKAQVVNFDLPGHADFGVYALNEPARRAAAKTRCSHQALEIVLDSGRRLAPRAQPRIVQHLWDRLDANPNQSVSGLARELGVTPEHATRLFHRHTGFSPRVFRSTSKLEQALVALAAGQPAAAVAQDCGFSDQPHLCRAIKRVTGKTVGALQRG